MTEEQKKEVWTRGTAALASILQYVEVRKVEALAKKIEDPGFRNSFAFRQFLKSL